ncbi:MAG: FAD-dependent oxidoreductase [Anaerolineae bacterium]|nr:FAD-dependent oxidoreductase [Anaerolineae bacterium]
MSDDIFPVVVIGAGLSGLTAGLHLAARDLPPLVLEADIVWPGGRIAGGEDETLEYNGQTWTFSTQHGIHALWGGYDNMRAMFDRFLKIQLRPSTGEEWINRWGTHVSRIEAGTAVRSTWFPPPFHYLQLLFRPRFWKTITWLDFFSVPGFLVSFLWAASVDPIREQIALEGLMLADFFKGWTPNLKAIFKGLGHSLLASPSEHITATAFIAAMRFYTMMRRDTWHLDYLPANPHECMIKPMIKQIEESGGKVMVGSRVETLTRADGHWQIRVEDLRLGSYRTLRAEHVILAVDPPAAKEILTRSPETCQKAQEMRFPRGLENAAIRLWFDAAPQNGAPGGMFTGDFLIDNFFWLHRIQDEFIAWHQQTGGSTIEVHLYAPESVFEQDDRLLIIQATKEVTQAFPELRGHFIHGSIRRNGPTQSQFLIPTEKSLHVITPWDNLWACGDWIGYPSPSLWMERCVVTAIAAANEVLKANQLEIHELIPPRESEWLVRIVEFIARGLRKTIGPVILGTARALRRKKRDGRQKSHSDP